MPRSVPILALSLCPLVLVGCGDDATSDPPTVVTDKDSSTTPEADAASPVVNDSSTPDTSVQDSSVPDLQAEPSPEASDPEVSLLDTAVEPAEEPGEEAASDAVDEVEASVGCPTPVYGPAGTPFPILGFGEGTLGGWQNGHDVYSVTSLSDDGPGTLRAGLQTNNQPRVILFEVEGTIALQTPLLVPSNITVDGRGKNIILQGKGMVLPGSDQVILINFAFEGVGPESEDGVQIGSVAPDSSEHIVLDHLRFTQTGNNGSCEYVDEAISVIFGSRNVTIAYCRFDKWEKVLLAGNGDADPSLDALITLTMHHSYANETGRRHPQARYGKYHLFNNFLNDWRMYGWSFVAPYFESFGSQIQDKGRMLLEGELVRRTPHLYDTPSQANEASRCELGGDLLEVGTWIDPTTTVPLAFGKGCAQQEGITPPYTVCVEEAGPALRDRVVAEAGNTLVP